MCACDDDVYVPLCTMCNQSDKYEKKNWKKRDDFTCNIKVETQLNVHRDVKQAVKRQDSRHVTEYYASK